MPKSGLVPALALAMGWGLGALAQDSNDTAFDAAAEGNLPAVDAFLAANGPADARESLAGWTLLMFAASNGHDLVVQKLLEKGADPNLKDPGDWTALIYAARNNHPEVVKLLLAKGAKIDAKNNLAWSALMYASFNGHEEVVKILLEQGADPNAVCWNGRTPLIYAAGNDHAGTIRILLGKGADPTVKDSNGWTALMYGEKNRKSRAVAAIQEYVQSHPKNTNISQASRSPTSDASPPRPSKN
jgi:ankyrin repeat protein